MMDAYDIQQTLEDIRERDAWRMLREADEEEKNMHGHYLQDHKDECPKDEACMVLGHFELCCKQCFPSIQVVWGFINVKYLNRAA